MFRDIQMRSRLEATWACFFELCKWPWEYEPFDMPGWIPDFTLAGHVLVEVKPFPPGNFKAWGKTITKIKSAWSQCWRDHTVDAVLLLGTSPWFEADGCLVSVGWLSESIFYHCDEVEATEANMNLWFAESPIGRYYGSGRIDFCHAIGRYSGRVFDDYDGGSYPDGTPVPKIWNRAKNLTQWKPRIA